MEPDDKTQKTGREWSKKRMWTQKQRKNAAQR